MSLLVRQGRPCSGGVHLCLTLSIGNQGSQESEAMFRSAIHQPCQFEVLIKIRCERQLIQNHCDG